MNKTKSPLLLLTFFCFGCNSQSSTKKRELLDPQRMTLPSFLNAVKISGGKPSKINFITMYDRFSEDWLKSSDIDTLVSLVNSNEKCYCFQNPLSSALPSPSDSADIGGYAIELIRAFQQKTKVSFGLGSCPKTNPKEANELIRWWETQPK